MYKLKIVELPKPLNIKTQINFPEVVLGKMQEKTVKPKTTFQEILPDKNYDGLSKVNVEAVTNEIDENIKSENIKKDVSILGVQGNIEELKGTTIEITKNGTYIPEEPYNAYTEVVANIEPDLSEYFGGKLKAGDSRYYYSYLFKNIKKIPLLEIEGTSCQYMFRECKLLTSIPLLDTSKVTNMSYMFNSCSGITTIPLLDTSNVTSMSNMFNSCSNLTTISQLDTSKVTNMGTMFYNCNSLTSIPLLDTSNVTNMSSMFGNCVSLTSIPQLDTSKVTTVYGMFGYCYALISLPLLNFSSVIDVRYLFNSTQSSGTLTILGGFQNLGQAYLTTQSANYNNYKLDLTLNYNLTHDSLMNVINNLYDIASKGVKTQQLVLGSTNIAKLTAEEIAIGTSKGWSIS